MPNNQQQLQLPTTPTISPLVAVLTLALVALGAGAAAAIFPLVRPALIGSLSGAEPKAFWYISRSSAIVAYLLLWAAMVFGMMISARAPSRWVSIQAAYDLHQYTSLLSLVFVFIHVLVLLGDHYINYSFVQLLLPLSSNPYRPFAVALGQIGLYLLIIVFGSFYVRQWIGMRAWRLIHYLSFVLFIGALAHGVLSGTDTGKPLMPLIYWGSAASVLWLLSKRLIPRQKPARKAAVGQRADQPKGSA